MELPLSVGQSRVGPLWVDLTRIPHVLVAGTTLYGKTAWIGQAVTALTLLRSPEQPSLLLVDFKRTEFKVFAGLPHLAAPMIYGLGEAFTWMARLNAEMDRRLALFEAREVNEIVSYNAKADEPLPYVVVVIDEVAELRSADGPDKKEQEGRKAALALIQRLGPPGPRPALSLLKPMVAR
jgi:DNA segregation ATPase FtsK/SpoIIIE, S-DNA-T family